MGLRLFKLSARIYTDEELMQRLARRGDEQAFEMLYDRYHAKLLWFSMRVVGNKEQAEDIVQETFIKLIENPGAFNPSQKFSTWIYTIVNRASLNSLRNDNRRAQLLSENDFQLQSTQLRDHTDAKRLQAEINTLFTQLNEKEKLVFILRFEHGLGIKEISNIAQIPEGSVKSCIYYLLKKISTHLKSQQVI